MSIAGDIDELELPGPAIHGISLEDLSGLRVTAADREPPVAEISRAHLQPGLFRRLSRRALSIFDRGQSTPPIQPFDEGGVERERRFNFFFCSLVAYLCLPWQVGVTSCVERALEVAYVMGFAGRELALWASSICLYSHSALRTMHLLVVPATDSHKATIEAVLAALTGSGDLIESVDECGRPCWTETGGRRSWSVAPQCMAANFPAGDQHDAWMQKVRAACEGRPESYSVLLGALPSYLSRQREGILFVGDATNNATCSAVVSTMCALHKANLDTVRRGLPRPGISRPGEPTHHPPPLQALGAATSLREHLDKVDKQVRDGHVLVGEEPDEAVAPGGAGTTLCQMARAIGIHLPRGYMAPVIFAAEVDAKAAVYMSARGLFERGAEGTAPHTPPVRRLLQAHAVLGPSNAHALLVLDTANLRLSHGPGMAGLDVPVRVAARIEDDTTVWEAAVAAGLEAPRPISVDEVRRLHRLTLQQLDQRASAGRPKGLVTQAAVREALRSVLVSESAEGRRPVPRVVHK